MATFQCCKNGNMQNSNKLNKRLEEAEGPRAQNPQKVQNLKSENFASVEEPFSPHL